MLSTQKHSRLGTRSSACLDEHREPGRWTFRVAKLLQIHWGLARKAPPHQGRDPVNDVG